MKNQKPNVIIIFVALLSFFSLTSLVPTVKKKIIFFGDSITQMGTNKGGYIDLIHDYLSSHKMDNRYEVIGSGVGYNKVYDLYLRMEEDVMLKKPDIVVIYVGINDVGHKYSTRTGTDIDKYEVFYAAIIKKLQAQKIKVVLCTPSLLGEKKSNANPQDAELDAYASVVRKLASSMSCQLIDLRSAFKAFEEEHNEEDLESGLLTTDRIHLTPAGNELVAREMIRELIK